jgi:hypothetical protein
MPTIEGKYLGFIALALLAGIALTACVSQTGQGSKEITNSTPAAVVPLVNITYAGGFAAPRFAGTTFIVTSDGVVSTQSKMSDGSLLSTSSRTLSAAELQQLKEILANITSLQQEYGSELRNQVADAGYADIALNDGSMRARINPNVGDAYPAALQPLRDWVEEQNRLLAKSTVFFCIDESRRAEVCYELYDPVCGNNARTYSNNCFACKDLNVTNYTKGECSQQPAQQAGGATSAPMISVCENASRNVQACTADYNPVCGSNGKTYGNGCAACKDKAVDTYAPGECASGKKQAVDCTEPRPDVCTKEYNPVCGQKNDSTSATYGNKCEACSDRNVTSYVQGACTQSGVPPIVGNDSDEHGCKASAGYSWCEAKQKCIRLWEESCTDATSGAAGGTRLALTPCTDPRPQMCTMQYDPVCAEVDNGIRCIKAPCPSTDRKTYSNACAACSDPKTYGYWPGSCEENGMKSGSPVA